MVNNKMSVELRLPRNRCKFILKFNINCGSFDKVDINIILRYIFALRFQMRI